MRIVTVCASTDFESIMGKRGRLGCLTDVVVAFETQGGLAVFEEVVRGAFVAEIAAVENRLVDGLGKQLRIAGSVWVMTRRAVERAEVRLKVGADQVLILGIVAQDAELFLILVEERGLFRSMGQVAIEAVIGCDFMACFRHARFHHILVARLAQLDTFFDQESFV